MISRKTALIAIIIAFDIMVLTLLGIFGYITRSEALKLVYNDDPERRILARTPADFDLDYQAVTLTTTDNYEIAGWYIPGTNGAGILAQHGFRSTRNEMLEEAALLNQAGYSIMMIDLRAHGESQGDMVTFGHYEQADIRAAYEYLAAQSEVNPDQIGMLGNSMGAAIAIQFTASEPGVRALVADSPFHSLEGTIETSLAYFTGLPAFPFAPAIRWWAEVETGINAQDIAAIELIASISPRPIFLLQAGADVVVNPESGALLYEAAREPKELWYEPDIGHVAFQRTFPEEYAERVTAFFNQHLLGSSNP